MNPLLQEAIGDAVAVARRVSTTFAARECPRSQWKVRESDPSKDIANIVRCWEAGESASEAAIDRVTCWLRRRELRACMMKILGAQRKAQEAMGKRTQVVNYTRL